MADYLTPNPMDVTPLTQKIAADIEKSGFPIEVITGSAFMRRYWKVTHQMVFRDLDEDKSRAIDVLAVKDITPASGRFKELTLWSFIECKKSDKPWVFYAPKNDMLQDQKRAISHYLKVASNPTLNIPQSTLLQNSHYVTRPPLDRLAQAHYIAFSGPKTKSDGIDQVWTALNQASKAAYFFFTEIAKEVSRKGASTDLNVFYPIIVLDGRIFLYSLDEDGKALVEETQYVKYDHATMTAESDLESFLIDIVAKDFLPTYIQWLDAEADLLAGQHPQPHPT